MSRIYLDGQYHDCTEEDLKRWDELAAKHESAREVEAKKEINRLKRKAKKEGDEPLPEPETVTQTEAPEGGG